MHPPVPNLSTEAWLAIAMVSAAGVTGVLYALSATLRDEERLRVTLDEADRLRAKYMRTRASREEIIVVDEDPASGAPAQDDQRRAA